MLVADPATDITFDFERDLLDADAKKPKKRPEVCQAFQLGTCPNGAMCPERHVITQYKSVQPEVCRYWLRGSCANGRDCVFMHEYEERFLPECVYFAKLGFCTNSDCNFKHVLPEDKVPECAAFKRGFCPAGPNCNFKHVKKAPCPYYLAGFCPLGPRCPLGHPVLHLYDRDTVAERLRDKLTAEERGNPQFNPHVTCLKCLDPGHLPRSCPGGQFGRLFGLLRSVQEPGDRETFSADGRPIGCFVCGSDAHTLRDCPEKDSRNGRRPGILGGGGMKRERQQQQH